MFEGWRTELKSGLRALGAVLALLIAFSSVAQTVSVIRSGTTTNTAQVDSNGALKVTTSGSAASTPAKTSMTVSSNATACTTAGGASCTTVLASTEIVSYARVAITVKNTGSNALSNCLVEFSPDGTSWEVWDTSTFGTLASGAIVSMQLDGNSRRYIRIEARSASGTTTDVWLTMSP